MSLSKGSTLRNRNSVGFVREIRTLRDGDYSVHQIAEKSKLQ